MNLNSKSKTLIPFPLDRQSLNLKQCALNLPQWPLLFVILLLKVPLALLFEELAGWITGQGIADTGLDEVEISQQILVAVMLGPILENLIFFALLIELYDWLMYSKIALRRNVFNTLPVLVICAVPFGLSHSANAFHMLVAGFTGLLYAGVYVFFKIRKERPLLSVTFLHAGWNLFVVIYNTYFD
jgi:hypothetical protein